MLESLVKAIVSAIIGGLWLIWQLALIIIAAFTRSSGSSGGLSSSSLRNDEREGYRRWYDERSKDP